ncbi:helix-turn-helix transcriptional regulator [Gracilimonas sp.]|uniref:helix-turn-helix transcriptional regulator n=1 Tax=Gracilimonas sp. TaxID=1974203 RepID=UPI0028727FD3|nr:helix-turn-helix transcriptional regulator [Gracilimonas sp.]
MISNNLKVERARISITQKDLANEIGVSRQTIHSIETGKFTPSVELALRLATFFKVSVEELFQLEEN